MDSKQKWKEKNPNYQKEYYEKNKDKITEGKRLCRARKKEHYAEVAKKRYDAKREVIIAQEKARRKTNPRKHLLNAARARAKRKGIPFEITEEDFTIPSECPLLEIPLFPGEGKVCDNSPTLDRKIPELGYVKGNVWVISFRANMIKNSSSFDEFQLISKNWSKYK